jgi:hypothetical protein
MTQIQGISADATQTFTISLVDGSTFNMILTFKPLQQGWFLSLTYGDFEVTNMRVCCVYNILEQFTGQIPFGIACLTNQNQEPMFPQDFQAGNAGLFVLDATDLANVEAFYAS